MPAILCALLSASPAALADAAGQAEALVARSPSLVTGRSGSSASPYGVCSHITRAGFSYRDESCRNIALCGIGAVRSDVDWWRCQPAKDAPLDFSFYDEAAASAEAQGLRFLPILMRPPKWASPIWEHLEEWGAFVEAFVRRYGARCPDVEIMNPALPRTHNAGGGSTPSRR